MNDTQATSLKEAADGYLRTSYYALSVEHGRDVDWQQVKKSATYHLKSASNYHAATWVEQVILAIQIARWVMWIIRQLKQRQKKRRRQAKG